LKIKNRFTWAAVTYLGVIFLIGLWGCDFYPTQSKIGLPSDHNQELGYAFHKPGYYAPLTNCVECHSEPGTLSLKGGFSETDQLVSPSCYQCHTDLWAEIEHTDKRVGPDGENYHKTGLFEPEKNCTECHGNDLKGGSYRSSKTPSCTECHDEHWDWEKTHTLILSGEDGENIKHVEQGMFSPNVYCSNCHGNTLKGGYVNGTSTKSCYECHSSDMWNWETTHIYELTGIDGSGKHVQDGLYDPGNNCTTCHGTDLTGGTSKKSCYECHTKAIWDWTQTHTLLQTGEDPQGYHDPVGLYEPDTYCSSCHGTDLKGGTFNDTSTKSCYECHDSEVWDWKSTHTYVLNGIDGTGKHVQDGLYDPGNNCTTCHGTDLTGGTSKKSCYECHNNAIWDWTQTHTLLKTGTDPKGYHIPDGLYEPDTYCSSCHGTDLKGGTFNGQTTNSCYECHNSTIWDWKSTHTVRKDGIYHHPSYKSNPSMCQDCHGYQGEGGSAQSCYGSGCHRSGWPPRDD